MWGKVRRVFSSPCSSGTVLLWVLQWHPQPALPWVLNSNSQAWACLKTQLQDKGQEMAKNSLSVDDSVLGQTLIPPGKAGVLWPTIKGRWAPHEQWWWLGPVPPILAVLMVAEGCCLSQPSFEPLGEVQLFSSCTSLSWSTFSSFLQSCPVQQASQGWRTSSPAWAPWKWLIYYNIGRERKKDSETQPSLGLGAISGSGGKGRTKSSETPQSGFSQDLNISNWNGPLFAPGCSYRLNALTFKGSIQEPWYLSVKANLEGIFAERKEFYKGFYLPDWHFISAQVMCSAGSLYNLPMVPHLTNFLSLVLRRSTD